MLMYQITPRKFTKGCNDNLVLGTYSLLGKINIKLMYFKIIFYFLHKKGKTKHHVLPQLSCNLLLFAPFHQPVDKTIKLDFSNKP